MLKYPSLTIILDFSELTNINILSGKCTLQSRMFLKKELPFPSRCLEQKTV